jgi:hypothetical protein
MDLKVLKEKYKIDDADSQELESFVESLNQKGIDESRKKGAEIKKHLTAIATLKDFIKNKFSIDPDGDMEEQAKPILEKLEKANKPPEGGSLQELEARITANFKKAEKELNEKWQKKLDDEAAAKLAVETKFKNSRITEILSSMIGDSIPAKDFVIRDFLSAGKVKLTDDNKVVFVDGDDEIDSVKGLDEFKKKNPHLVISQQAPGSGGSGNSRSQRNNSGGQTIKFTDWMALPPKERAAFQLNDKNIVLPRED